MTEQEFALIIEKTKKTVLAAIGRTLFERFSHAIDDVAQETFIRAYRHLSNEQFRGDSAITTWLYTIARNESLRMNKKLSREEEKVSFLSKVRSLASPEQSPNDEEIDRLKEMVQQLPEKYRVIMELVSEGKNEKEIAQHLSIKSGTVKSRASRAREMLKRMKSEAAT